MKKELSPGLIIGAIAGLVIVIVAVVFFAAKSDPAAQAPNPPPRFDPGAKAAEYNSKPGGGGRPGMASPGAPIPAPR